MSEHYDFHYQPTGSGAISGQQVLQQTEDAINELGDYVNDNVGGAMDVAQQALETAQTAETNAQTALDTANSFSGAIQSAQQDASTALSTAQTAQTTASNANNTAIQAQQDASSAVTTANNASGQVSTLSGTVTALGQRVTTAEGNIGQNTSDITALTTRVGTAEGNITTLQNDVSIAQGNASSAMATAGTVKQQAYVLRYSSSSVTDNSTIAYSTLDNTDNIKSGDKVIDVDGKIFTVVSVDTANQTVTVGSALIDLALDSNVVHTSGDETVGGVKSFINYFLGKDLSGQTVDLNDCVDAYGGAIHYYYAVSNYTNISNKPENKPFILESKTVRYVSSIDYIYYQKIYTAEYNASPSIYTRYYRSGSASWSNWVKDTNKFVTTDTAQTISGSKTFSSNVNVYNSDTSASTPKFTLRSSKSAIGTSDTDIQTIYFSDKNDISLASVEAQNFTSNGATYLLNTVNTKDTNDQIIQASTSLYILNNGRKVFRPNADNDIFLGYSLQKWKDCQTYLINGLTPSSLGMPSGNANDVIDISSYISDLSENVNNYTAPANGWISIAVVGTAIAIVSSRWSDSRLRESSGNVRMLYPVLKNETVSISIAGTTLAYARFIPCQGNV